MEAGGDEDGEKEAPAAGAQELTGPVPSSRRPTVSQARRMVADQGAP